MSERLYIIIQAGDGDFSRLSFLLRRWICSHIWVVCGASNQFWKTPASRANRWVAERTKLWIWKDVCSLTYYRCAHSHFVPSDWFMIHLCCDSPSFFLCCRCRWEIINCALTHWTPSVSISCKSRRRMYSILSSQIYRYGQSGVCSTLTANQIPQLHPRHLESSKPSENVSFLSPYFW